GAAMRKVSSRPQRTLARPVEISGVGFVTGTDVRVRFRPASPYSGVVFVRTDLPGKPAIAANAANVTGATRRTTLGRTPAKVEMVEHVLAALAGLCIDNCTIETDGPELPGLDGSALGFAAALCEAGVTTQPARRDIWTVEEAITVGDSSATLTLHPIAIAPFPPGDSGQSEGLRVTYLLDYGPKSPIWLQRHTHQINPENFLNGLADCRTFLLEEEAKEFRRMGWGTRVSPSDLLIFGASGPQGNRLRYADEPARHKVLDIVGDLALSGH